jgi:uncharacterized protein
VYFCWKKSANFFVFMNRSLQKKYKHLKSILQKMGSVLIAFSGGVDSTFLLKTAVNVLDSKVLAVTADSAAFPASEVKFSRKMAVAFNVRYKIIKINELANQNYLRNHRNRCYWCKKILFAKLKKIARQEKLNFVVDGSNLDDCRDYRPGNRAAAEAGVRSPLKEAGLTKNEIRMLSAFQKLPTRDKPAMACLASRIPYNTKISSSLLARIERAEEFLKRLGFRFVRVRHHGPLARIEVPAAGIQNLVTEKTRRRINHYFKKLGYFYVTVDLEGYRSGSMNEVLNHQKRGIVRAQPRLGGAQREQ